MTRWDRGSSGETGVEGLIGLSILILGVILVGGFWLIIKVGSLLIRVISHHYRNRVLQVSLGVVCFLIVLLIATGGQSEGVDVLTVVSVMVLVSIATVIETISENAPSQPVNLESVMPNPWWEDS
jgi:hypothetical protein